MMPGVLAGIFGLGTVVIHFSRFLRFPSELAISQPPDKLYCIVRRIVIRNSLLWGLGLLVLPVTAFELLQLTPRLLPVTSFAWVHNWAVHGPILASWLFAAILLSALAQYFALRNPGRPFYWELGWYILTSVVVVAAYNFSFMLQIFNLITVISTISVLMLSCSIVLWIATRRRPRDFNEIICRKP